MTAPTDDELRSLLAAATPGPWEIATSPDGHYWQLEHDGDAICNNGFCYHDNSAANCDLLYYAPALAAEVLRLRAEVATAQRDGAAAMREAAAKIAANACLVPPDGGSPTREETEMCDFAATAIRALPLPGDQ